MNESIHPAAMAARLIVALAAALSALGACGGGGSGGDGSSSVSSATLDSGSAHYSQPLTFTVSGSNVEAGLSVTSPQCKDVQLSSDPAKLSTAAMAHFQCTVTGLGPAAISIARSSDGTVLATIPFTVLAPVVTLAVDNGAGTSGTMFVTLAPDKAPITVDNFLSYVNSGFYAGTLIHRVVPGFVVQGGGYVAPLNAAPGTLKAAQAPIALETGKGLSNTQWSIAMARSSDANSATSQFFVNLVDNSGSLDPSPVNGPGNAVFGVVSAGTSAVTAIVHAPCTAIPLFLRAGECTPTPNMVITSAVQTQ